MGLVVLGNLTAPPPVCFSLFGLNKLLIYAFFFNQNLEVESILCHRLILERDRKRWKDKKDITFPVG